MKVLGADLGDVSSAEEAVRACEERFRAVLDATDDVTFVLDTGHRYVGIWGRWLADHGQSRDDYLGKTSWEIFGADDKDYFKDLNSRALTGENIVYEHWFDLPWGKVCYQTSLSPLRDAKGAIVGIVGDGRDITKLKRTEDRLAYLASHDPLTELPNRRSLENAVARALARTGRGASSVLLFIDLDNFKDCNDTLGHGFGDGMLQKVAQALRQQVRLPDIVARVGGDEFAALLESASIDDARAAARRMGEAVRALPRAEEFCLDLSIGIKPLKGGITVDEALAGADLAMYEAKRSDELRVVVHGESR